MREKTSHLYRVTGHVLAAAMLLLAAQAVLAQPGAWKPEKNVEIVASSAVGGGNDATARFIRELFRNKRFIPTSSSVVNRPGGGGAEAWAYLNRHAGDGHYLAISVSTLLSNRITGADALGHTDVTPITTLSREYILTAVRRDSPIKTGRDLAARLRQDTASVSIGFAPALGNNNHIAAALLARAAGGDARKLRIVVYETGSKAAAAVTAGQVDAVFAAAGTILRQARTENLRLVGLTAPRRLGTPLAGVPTWKEQGYDVVFSGWRGIVGPRGMTPAQVAYWEDVLLKLSFDDDWIDDLRKQSWDGVYLNSSETRKFLEAQYTLMKNVLTDLGLAR